MKRFLAAVLSSVLVLGVGAGLAGCKGSATAASGDSMASYNCAMEACGKTKQAKMGDPAPS